jgi:CheY-like chemotaxis protein
LSRLLVIEDSPAIALLLRRRLEMAGHSLDIAPTGETAIAGLDGEDLPDVVLADVMMPGIDGIETARRMKALHPDLPVILVTGKHIEPALRRGVDAVIAKPIEFDQLLDEISRLSTA